MRDSTPAEKRRKLFSSMVTLAGLVGASVLLTSVATSYFRGQDPVNQCITNPESQPFQISVRVEVFENGTPVNVRGVGTTEDCIRPVHTVEDNIIHVAYSRPHPFTLGHFFYYWLGDDLLNYETRVHVNDVPHSEGDFRDIVLQEGDTIRIELTTRSE